MAGCGLAQRFHLFLTVVGVVLLTVATALMCGGPILFPDSVGYFHAGSSALGHFNQASHAAALHGSLSAEEKDGISTARSVYYGIFYVSAFRIGGQWLVLILQAAICGVVLALSLRRLVSAWRVPVFAVALTCAAGLSVFCAAAMPDLFAGLLLLALSMVITYSRCMGRFEYLFWIGIIFTACLFHRGHLAVLIAALAICACAKCSRNRQQIGVLVIVAAIALIAHFAVDLVVKDLSGRWPIQTPFLLARFIGDGTAQPYLARNCDTKHYALCRFHYQWPMTENEFLWGDRTSSVMGSANAVDRERIAEEAPSIELGIIKTFPVREGLITIKNIWTQFLDVGVSSYEQGPTLSADRPITALHGAIARYLRRNVALADEFMRAQSFVMSMTYLFSFVSCLSILVLDRSCAERPAYRMVLILLIGLVANAIIFGAISGVFDRYQGRLVWLPALGLVVLLSKRGKAEGVVAA